MKNISTADLTPEQRKAVTIDFPCAYPIKVVGQAGDELATLISDILATLQVEVDTNKTTVRPSSTGRWQSITITITANSSDQLATIFNQLKQSPLVQMVL